MSISKVLVELDFESLKNEITEDLRKMTVRQTYGDVLRNKFFSDISGTDDEFFSEVLTRVRWGQDPMLILKLWVLLGHGHVLTGFVGVVNELRRQ